MRGHRQTETYRKAIRKVWVEPLFTEGKAWHGTGRFRPRTLRRVNAEALLVASGQNLKRLLCLGGSRPKEPAQVALLPPMHARLGVVPVRAHRAKPPRPSGRSFCNRLPRFREASWRVLSTHLRLTSLRGIE